MHRTRLQMRVTVWLTQGYPGFSGLFDTAIVAADAGRFARTNLAHSDLVPSSFSDRRQRRQPASRPISRMGIDVKLLSALGGSALAGGFLLGAAVLDRGGGASNSRGDPLCHDGSKAAEATYFEQMRRANARMHADMEITPSGNIDRDFARMMIAHHQGAIDMALVQLKYGGDGRMKRLAQSIIVEQGQEITYMRSLLDRNQT